MSLSHAIAKNTIIHALGKIISLALGLLIIGLLTRYLGTEGYGYYTTIFAYLFFFTTLGDLGLYLVTVNNLGRVDVDQKKWLSNAFALRFVSVSILMLLAVALIWLFPYPFLVKIGVMITALALIFGTTDQITVAFLQAKMSTKYAALAEVAGKIAILVLVLLAIKLKFGFLIIMAGVAIGFFIHFLVDFLLARKIMKFGPAFDKQMWREILQQSWPIATYMIFSMLYFKADTIILSLYHSQTVVGLYGAPYKILEVLITFPAIFMGLVSPLLARAWSEKNLIDFQRLYQRAFDFLSLAVWPLIFGTIVLARPIINFIAGRDFLPSAAILPLIIVATGIIFWAHLSTFSVVAIGQQRPMMKYYILAAALALILYFAFIPKYSYWAAASVTVLVEFFILIASWLMVKKNTHLKVSFKNNLKCLFASLIMALVLFLTNFGFGVKIVLGVLIYLAGLWFLGILPEEKELMAKVFNKKI